ncbi:MAG: 50S ribosomal protein L11 [Nanoarchaeota archaeon]|nr:50S ribosomal protein L11 [Nanoarchaeota archaeon]
MAKEKIKALVDGGKATAGPPLGPKLGPLGVNVSQIIADINKATKDFEGIKVPIELIVDTETKTWEIHVGSPPTSQLLFKELGIQKGSGSAWKEGNQEKPPVVGDAKRETIVKIAKLKQDAIGAKTLKAAVKCVLGTCVSCGITVEGKNPKEAQKEVDEGKWDDILK